MKTFARTVRLPDDIDKALRVAAAEKRVTQNALLLAALRTYPAIKAKLNGGKANAA